jgi:hypothetical protein
MQEGASMGIRINADYIERLERTPIKDLSKSELKHLEEWAGKAGILRAVDRAWEETFDAPLPETVGDFTPEQLNFHIYSCFAAIETDKQELDMERLPYLLARAAKDGTLNAKGYQRILAKCSLPRGGSYSTRPLDDMPIEAFSEEHVPEPSVFISGHPDLGCDEYTYRTLTVLDMSLPGPPDHWSVASVLVSGDGKRENRTALHWVMHLEDHAGQYVADLEVTFEDSEEPRSVMHSWPCFVYCYPLPHRFADDVQIVVNFMNGESIVRESMGAGSLTVREPTSAELKNLRPDSVPTKTEATENRDVLTEKRKRELREHTQKHRGPVTKAEVSHMLEMGLLDGHEYAGPDEEPWIWNKHNRDKYIEAESKGEIHQHWIGSFPDVLLAPVTAQEHHFVVAYANELLTEEYSQAKEAAPKHHGCLEVLGDFERVICGNKTYPLKDRKNATAILKYLCTVKAFSRDTAKKKGDILQAVDTQSSDWKPSDDFSGRLKKLYDEAIGRGSKSQGIYWIKPK